MDSLTFNIKVSEVSKKIGSEIFGSDDPVFIQTGLEKIGQNISNYDDFVFAGRLLINAIVRSIHTMDVYLTLNSNRLAPHISKYMYDHKETFDRLLSEYEIENYNNQDYFSADTLRHSYLLRADVHKEPTETPILSNLRLAVQFHYENGIEEVIQAFHDMCNSYYTHATPTKFNAGTKDPQMASCFLLECKDSLDPMYQLLKDMAIISRYSGGIGLSFNDLRHSDIAGFGMSAGVLPFARVCDKSVSYVDQARKRRGAATGFLNVWHIDIEEFVQAASNFIPQDLRLVSVHTCIWTHDLFFDRNDRGEDWTLFCPNTVPELKGKYGAEFEKIYVKYEKLAPIREQEFLEADAHFDKTRHILSNTKHPTDELRQDFIDATAALKAARKARIVSKTINSRDILRAIADTQLKSGKPYVMNGDKANAKSNQQNLGPINNSNLCVEIVQYSDHNTYASCNLASINLPKFVNERYVFPTDDSDEAIMTALGESYDFEVLGKITRSVTNNINQVITHNFYPLEDSKIKKPNLDNRPLGIGVSGLDDTFKCLDIVYGSRESIILNKMIFACMYYNGLVESNRLAKIEGEYATFRTGTCSVYSQKSGTHKTYRGSSLSNGFFQFDLWDAEYHQDKALGRINEKIYDPKDNIPVDPKYFSGKISWDDLRRTVIADGVRNSLLLALMPTASTAHLLRNAETVEAHQANIYSRTVGNGSYTIVNRHLHADLGEIELHTQEVDDFIYNNAGNLNGLAEYVKENYSDIASKDYPRLNQKVLDRVRFLEEKYKTMFDIKPSLFLSMARQRGIYVDQSQSTNIYLIDPSLAQLMGVQMVAYHNKLKTHIYYLRNTIPTLNTGFNKKITEEKVVEIEEEIPSCKIDDPECLMCGS